MLLPRRRDPKPSLRTHARARPVDYRISDQPTFRIPRKHGKKRKSVIMFAKGVLAANMWLNTEEFQVFRGRKKLLDKLVQTSANSSAMQAD